MIYLFGASGHGLVVLDILQRLQKSVHAFLDDADKPALWGGIPVIKTPDFRPESACELIISIGSNAIRKKLSSQWHQMSFGTAIHPSAVVAASAEVGSGTVVMAGAIINPFAKVGRHAIINTGVVVDHECVLGDYVHLSPNATLCGNVQVGNGAWIGAGATIVPGISIGENAMVGAGSVVTKNIPSGATAVGIPARIIKSLK